MDIADEVLVLLQSIEKATNKRILNKNKKLKNKYLSLSRWDRVSVAQAFRRYAGIDDNELFDHNVFFKKAEEKVIASKDLLMRMSGRRFIPKKLSRISE